MPQAISFSTTAASSAASPNTSSVSPGGGSSRFNDLLDSARQSEASSSASAPGDATSNAKPAANPSPSDKTATGDTSGANVKNTTKAGPKKGARRIGQSETGPEDAALRAVTSAAEDANPSAAAEAAAAATAEPAKTAPAKAKPATDKSSGHKPSALHEVHGNDPGATSAAVQPGNASTPAASPNADGHAVAVADAAATTASLQVSPGAAQQPSDAASASSTDSSAQPDTSAGQTLADAARTPDAAPAPNKVGGKVGQSGKSRVNAAAAATDPSVNGNADTAVAPDAEVDQQVAEAADAALAGAGSNTVADKPEANAAAHHQQPLSFGDVLAEVSGAAASSSKNLSAPTHAAATAAPPAPIQQPAFADANHNQIVTAVQSHLLPSGGSMQLQLHPADLGAMSVSVHMHEGVMTATFETATDQAAKLLTHSLGQLKTALEAQGVSVGRLHVQQAPRDSQTDSGNSRNKENSPGQESSSRQQEHQRREMLRRMWQRLSGGGQDPLDMVA